MNNRRKGRTFQDIKLLGRSIIIKGNKTNGVNRLNSVHKAISLDKNQVGINEMYSDC